MPSPPSALPFTAGSAAVLEKLLEMVRCWWRQDGLRQQFSRLTPDDRNRVLLELGLTPADLPALLAGGRRPETLLPRVAARFGVDAGTMIREAPPVWRDFQRSCITCTGARRCRRALRQPGTASFLAFCPNAQALGELQADHHAVTASTDRETPAGNHGKPEGFMRSLWRAYLSEPFVGTD